MAHRRVVLIGAGMAGLSAAHELRRAGVETIIFESSDRVGGRTSSEHRDGYLYERGTQFYVSTYTHALGLIREMGLASDLRPASDWITVLKDGRLLRMSAGLTFAFHALKSRMLTLSDLARFTWHTTRLRWPPIDDYSAWAKYDDQDTARWAGSRLGRAADYLVEPVLAGGMMQQIEETSRAAALVVLATTANGRSKDMTLANGNDSLPRAMARNLDIKLESPVQKLESSRDGVTVHLSGETITADAAVLATTASTAAKIYAGGDRLEHDLLAATYGSVIKVGLAVGRGWSKRPELADAWAMMIPRDQRKDIVSVTIESAKDRARVPDGCEMLNLFVTPENADRMMDWPDDQIMASVAPDIERLFPGAMARKQFASIVRWREAMPKLPVGRARALAEYRTTRANDARILLAGDYMGIGTLESAIQTGRWAANFILKR